MNTKKSKRLTWLAVALLILAALGIELWREQRAQELSSVPSIEEAQLIVNEAFDSLISPTSGGAVALAERLNITVNSLTEGAGKSVILSCSYETVNVREAVMRQADDLLNLPLDNPDTGRRWNATQIQLKLQGPIAESIRGAETISGTVELEIFETENGKFSLYCADREINLCFGGILDLYNDIANLQSITVDGEEVDISSRNTLRNGLKSCIALTNYETSRPDTSGPLLRIWNSFVNEFKRNFIDDGMWEYLADGLLVTLELTACAIALGLLLGFLVAIVRTTHDRTGSLGFLNSVCRVYLSVIRGTPVMIQLLIIHFVILLPMGVPKFLSAVLCFGLNSGAYVAEIIRGGIMSVEQGQTEAGRSLGLNYAQTMIYIIIPQAIKAVLPSLANEFIVLLKESSVAFYIGVADLTQGGLRIRSLTYSNFMPLLAVAFIYWVVVIILTYLVGILERRLRKSER